MPDIAPYSFTDPWTGVAQGMKIGNALRQDTAEQQAGASLVSGDYAGGANALLTAGDIPGGFAVANAGQAQADRSKAKSDAARQAVLQTTGDIADHLAFVSQRSAKPEDVLATWDTLSPRLKALGESDADIAQVRASLLANPAVTIASLRTGVEKELGPQKPIELDPAKNIYTPHTGFETAPAPAAPTVPGSATVDTLGHSVPPPPAPPTPGAVTPDAVWKSIHTQESGGEASPGTAVGPDTAYGNALGSTQMLPATAEAMARKVGVPWNPALMRENSPQALAYQDKLGRAYFDEGLDKSGGDPAAAAAYYFGGPDPALHGPKTAAYVKQVMARAGASPTSLEGGAGTDVMAPPPAIPGYDLVQAAHPKDTVKWTSDGKGFLHNADGDVKPDPSFGDAALTPEAVSMGATRYAMTGVMPATGFGAAARQDKVKIQNEGAKLIKQWGITPEDWVTGMAQFKVAQGSLGQISKTKNMVEASEHAVVANMNNVVLPLMTKVAPGGVPFINRYAMAIRDHAFGDPDVKAYDNALHTVADEYAKVMTTTSGAGGSPSSDSARNEAYRRLSTSQTAAQLQETFKTLQAEMANRRQALASQESALTEQLRHGLSPAPVSLGGANSPPTTAAPVPDPAAPGQQRLTAAQAAQLPPGTHFVGLDGVPRVHH